MADARIPRVVSPDGRMLYGTWPGPQSRIWDYRGRYGLIAGSGFSGKTELLRWYCAQQIAEDDARIAAGEIEQSYGHALYLRREMPLLRETMQRCERDFEKAWPAAKWKAKESAWVWPSGYRLTFGHMQHPEDWQKYASWQITLCLWDELPTFVEKQWQMLDMWVRQPAGSKLTPMHRAGGNPIGVGREWVRKFFVDVGPEGKEVTKTTIAEVEDEDGTRRKEKVTRSRVYIFAKVSDNKSVDQAAYIASFEDKPANIIAAMREGDWGAATGDLIGQCWDKAVHVVKPYTPPPGVRKGRSIHFSFVATTVKWWLIDFDGNFSFYRDLKLVNHTAEMVADRVRELEEENGEWLYEDGESRGSKITGVLGPASAWAKAGQRGPSPAETMRAVGVYNRPADDNLQAAADQIRMRLIRRTLPKGAKKGDPGVPGLRYFSTCETSLENVPSAVADKTDPDLPDPGIESSAYKALAYAAMSRPVVPEKEKPRDDDFDNAPRPRRSRVSRTGIPGCF